MPYVINLYLKIIININILLQLYIYIYYNYEYSNHFYYIISFNIYEFLHTIIEQIIC